MTGKNGGITRLEEDLRAKGIDIVAERFRLPARPQVSVCAWHAASAAGAFLLCSGNSNLSFLVCTAGALILLLDGYGFSPLSWLGPKEWRTVLVLPGTPSEPAKRASFLAVPLRCSRTHEGNLPRRSSARRSVDIPGLALGLFLPFWSGAAAMHYLPPTRSLSAFAGVAMLLLGAAQWFGKERPTGGRNLAADRIELLLPEGDAKPRPFVLLYPGDPAEVKFFLAKYRGMVFRGAGLVVEISAGTSGGPAASDREGPLLPYRVDPSLLCAAREAAESAGVLPLRESALREKTAGLFAMARGFRAISLYRLDDTSGGGREMTDEAAFAWARGVAERVARRGRSV